MSGGERENERREKIELRTLIESKSHLESIVTCGGVSGHRSHMAVKKSNKKNTSVSKLVFPSLVVLFSFTLSLSHSVSVSLALSSSYDPAHLKFKVSIASEQRRGEREREHLTLAFT